MTEAKQILDRTDAWMFDGYRVDARVLGLCRMAFAGYLLFFQFRRLDWIAAYPADFFDPPAGLPALLPGFPPAIFLHLLNIAGVVTLLLLFAGKYTRIASLAFFAVLMLYVTTGHSFGKIDHVFLLLCFPLLMGLSGWGGALSRDAIEKGRGPSHAWPLSLMALLIGFGWFTAGLVKLLNGWLDPATQAAWGNVVMNFHMNQRDVLLASHFAGTAPSALWELADWTTVLFELGFLPAVLFPRVFRAWAGIAVLFHGFVLLSMGIDFSPYVLVYLPFLDWPAARGRLPRLRGAVLRFAERLLRVTPLPVLVLLAAGLLAVLYFAGGSVFAGILRLFGAEAPLLPGLLVTGSTGVLVLVLLFFRIRAIFRDASPGDPVDQPV